MAWFDGDVSAEERATIDADLEACRGHPPSFVRVAALDMLITEGPHGSQGSWRTIARQAANVALNEHLSGTADPYERIFDVPLYYLRGEDDEVLERIESQRRAGLYLRPLFNDRSSDTPSAAQELMAERRLAVDEIRALRLVLQYESLPQRLQLRWSMFAPQHPPPEAGWWDEEEAYRRLRELATREADLTDQIDAVAPGYAVRRKAGASVEDFAAALSP